MGLILLLATLAASDAYVASIEEWRKMREENLKSDTGWLTVAGLAWLKPGANVIELPRGATVKALEVELNDGQVAVGMNGNKRTLKLEEDVLRYGPVSVLAIKRGERYAIRIRDLNTEYRKAFTGLKWYAIKPQWRIEARFIPYDPPRKMKVPNIIGGEFEEPNPGYVEFFVQGKKLRLDPVLEDDKLFLIFRDATAGRTTYPPGRFLYADLPQSGKVVLDFNKAYSPPCAFTPYATCPLPPKQNRLPIQIEAGELNYGGH
jgi:uncharacterized protein